MEESSAESDDEAPKKKHRRKHKKKEREGSSHRTEQEQDVKEVFQQLKKRHEDKEYSGPLWACMIVAKTHNELDNSYGNY